MTHAMEERLSSLLRGHARDEVAALAVQTYGGELYGFVVHVVGESVGAANVFSHTLEDFWRGLPGFRGGCSVRIWLYRLAYEAAMRHRRSPWSRAAPAGSPVPPQLVAATHTMTASWRAELEDRWHELRRELSPEDRALLVLRVDRGLAWNEVAQIMLSESADDPAAETREAARLRQRLQLLKDQLRARARAAGLR